MYWYKKQTSTHVFAIDTYHIIDVIVMLPVKYS